MQPRFTSLGFTILLGALAALPPLSIDMGLPAFGALERDLGASAGGAGLTLSVFLAGFSIAQLALGPLSDRVGRRPVLLVGVALYALAGIACATASGIYALIGLRLVQGACAASGTVMALAVVRDLFTGAAARTRLSYVAAVLSVAPIIAPTLGSWTLLLGGWRAIYGFLGFAGVALWSAVVVALPETRPPGIVPPRLLAGFTRMLRHRSAIASALTNALSFGALFAYISGSPLVLMDDLGASAPLYGMLFALTSGGIMLGAGLNGWLSGRGVEPARPLLAALLTALACALGVLAVIGAGQASLLTLMPLLMLHCFARGVITPNAMHGALEPMGDMAGLAASVVGFLQMAAGALASGAVAALYPRLGPMAMALLMVVCSVAALALSRCGGPRARSQEPKSA